MQKKIDSHIFLGMRGDLTISAQDGRYLRDARNIRLTTRDNETFLALTNEKGAAKVKTPHSYSSDPDQIVLPGCYIGHCVITDYLVVFSQVPPHPSPFGDSATTPIEEGQEDEAEVASSRPTVPAIDYIFRIDKSKDYETVILFSGNLGFALDHPIETLASVESATIQKVYWVDGKNQPRVINITKDLLEGINPEDFDYDYSGTLYNPDSFDFVQKMSLQEEVTIQKNYDSAGFFPAGVLQYALTYFNKYGQQSNIFYTSPLIYTSYKDRAGSAEENIYNSFTININKLDQGFDYVRIYSIMRTSLDDVPTVKALQDIQIPKDPTADTSLSYVDTNTEGGVVDPTLLLYVGGTPTVFNTLAAKDNTLFLANYKVLETPVSDEYKQLVRENLDYATAETRDVYIEGAQDFYNTLSPMESLATKNLTDPRGFKYGETYRFGFQLQDIYGKWSEPIYIDDWKILAHPEVTGTNDTTALKVPVSSATIPLTEEIRSKYKRIRGLVVYPSVFERQIITQGLACPTIYNVRDREAGNIHNQASWFLRVTPGSEDNKAPSEGRFNRIFGGMYKIQGGQYLPESALRANNNYLDPNNGIFADSMSTPQYLHDAPLCSDTYRAAEIQGIPKEFGLLTSPLSYQTIIRSGDANTPFVENSNLKPVVDEDFHSIFKVDQQVINILSPEVEFEKMQDSTNVKIVAVGKSIFTKTTGKYTIETSTPAVGFQKEGVGFDDITLETGGDNIFGSAAVVSGLFWKDYLVAYNPDIKISTPWWEQTSYFRFMVYPWQAIMSLCNDSSTTAEIATDKYALLRKKLLYNYKYAEKTAWLTSQTGYANITNTTIIYEDQQQLTRYQNPDGEYTNYYNNIDTAITTVGPCFPTFAVSNEYAAGVGGVPEYQSYLGKIPPSLNSVNLYGGMYGTGGNNPENKFATGPTRVPIFNPDEDTNPLTNKFSSLMGWQGDHGYSENVRCWQQSGAIRMKYKTAPHILTKLTTPLNTDAGDSDSFLWLVEVQRDQQPDFGGNSEEALKQNLWIPAGPSKLLGEGDTVTVEFLWGDTWYQRYEHLKCYQFAPDDVQSIVEIGSFLCETRENIDGRYDRNKGPLANKYVAPENFNLINKVYSQQNNFFTYRILDKYYYNNTEFYNTITWTKEKQPVADVDLWTNITLASNLYLDNAHPVTALKVFNDNIYAFQKSGIYGILFNSRVQIPTSDGVPIEISNNYKVSGKREVSSVHGCNNKYEIVVGNTGLYFRDYATKELYVFSSGEKGGLAPISEQRGFSHWFKHRPCDPWIPKNLWYDGDPTAYSKFYYDNHYSDLYIASVDECLGFSEKSGEFISFYDYDRTAAMFNIGPDFYCLTTALEFHRVLGIVPSTKLWKMFAGNYNYLLETYKPFYFTYISQQDPSYDKIYTNLEYRADFYKNGVLEHNKTFDFIRATTEYQDTQKVSLLNKRAIKKFRIWRVDIPRHKNTRDRIRNTWCKITLGMNAETNDYSNVELHDLQTIYYT